MAERLPPQKASATSRLQAILARVLALVVGAALLVGGFLISVAFFAVAFAVALIAIGVLLWKTRHIRRQMREQMRQQGPVSNQWPPSGGDVIEGEVLRSSDDAPRKN
jgi:hypothetical protein